MKTICKIAKKELQLLFYSPVAWFMLILFVVQTGMLFVGKYEGFMKNNQWGSPIIMASANIFMRGLWGMVQSYMYFYIPLLTMGLISKELHSGSIKLLYSSPVTNAQIILGKFFSMVVYAAVMCGILLVYVIFAWCTVKDFEIQAILTGVLGSFLVICTYSAIGIFVSSLTSYQFVAAIGTFIMLMLLSMVGGLWQEYDVVRDITYWLCINGRAGTFMRGMICSEDLLYFPIVTALFLFMTVLRLNAIRQKIPFRLTLGRYIGVILVACFLGYLSSRPKLMVYYDATSNKMNTLTPASQEVVAKLDGGLSITGYANILDPLYGQYAFPNFIQRNRELFQNYERFKPEMKLKMVYYYDTITPQDDPSAAKGLVDKLKQDSLSLWQYARKRCEVYGLDSSWIKTPEEVRAMTDLTGERTFVWQIVRENGDKAWLRTYQNDLTPYPKESEITAALKRMTMDLPKVGFVTGYGLRSITDKRPQGYSTIAGEKHFRQSLLNQGFDAVEVDLKKGVPADVDILTIADVRKPFTTVEEQALEAYVNRGGNLYILGEPRRREEMNPFLRKLFGVELLPGTLVQYRYDWLQPDVLSAMVTPAAKQLTFYYALAWFVMMPTTSGISVVEDKGFHVTPLLFGDTLANEVYKRQPRSYAVWNEMESLAYEEEPLVCNPEAGEVPRGDYITAMALTRKVGDKEQRVVITGDADCISNGELIQRRSQANFVMILGTYHYLSYNEMPVDVRRWPTTDTEVSINREGYKAMQIGFLGVFPLAFFGVGLYLWLRRRGQ